jgi:hypothetical protein
LLFVFVGGLAMTARLVFWLVLVLGVGAPWAASAQTGWMQPGVRVWYFGGAGNNQGTLANATEAYLFQSVVGNNAIVIRHAAATNWTLPQPVQTLAVNLADQGPFWIPPPMLQTIKVGDHWYDPAQEITEVKWLAVPSYVSFLSSVLPPKPGKMHLLPVKALFDLAPQGRQVVMLTYFIPNTLNAGNAWFDAQTGLLLYRIDSEGVNKTFFMLSEINYDFARQVAFAEDNGPHSGFRSWTFEFSATGGGGVDIQSLVETRYGANIEMRVQATFTPPYGMLTMGDENYCFFGDTLLCPACGVPLVTKALPTVAPDYPPEQWTAVGQHLWWWLPATAMGGAAPVAAGTDAQVGAGAQLGAAPVQAINVLDVPMAKISDSPLTYAATQTPQRFHFNRLLFDSSGYMTEFWARDPTTGLDVKPPFMAGGGSSTVVEGLSYFTTKMHPRRLRDFDGDARSDPTVFRNGTWFELRSSTGAYGVGWGAAGDTPVPADYDGDGRTDVAVFRAGTWFIVRSSTNVPAGVPWGAANDIPVPADYDGDGKADVTVFRAGTWFIVRSSTNTPVGIPWGQVGDIPVPADYDGDGKADVAVFRPSAGTWYIVRSTTNAAVGVPWGQLGDIPVPADYDGDGKADPAVFRASVGTWFQWRSTTASAFGVVWGGANDTPIAGDYDGDGKADPTVFRNGTWFQWRSTTGATGFMWGVAGDWPM